MSLQIFFGGDCNIPYFGGDCNFVLRGKNFRPEPPVTALCKGLVAKSCEDCGQICNGNAITREAGDFSATASSKPATQHR